MFFLKENILYILYGNYEGKIFLKFFSKLGLINRVKVKYYYYKFKVLLILFLFNMLFSDFLVNKI